MDISNDDFIRTTEERHKRASQAIWQALERNGDIYLGKYAGWYAVRDEAFYGEDELTVGPDGKKRAPSGAEVEWVEEPSYFFQLSAWQDRLLKFYEDNPGFIAAQQPPQRSHQLRPPGPYGSFGFPHHLQLGREGAGCAGPHHVRLARRADQLHHRGRLSRHRQRRCSRRSGRPTCTWSARTSCASMRCTGRPS